MSKQPPKSSEPEPVPVHSMDDGGDGDEGIYEDEEHEEKGAAPSKVLHVRGLPPGMSEQQLIALGSAIKIPVAKVLLLNNKGQAFVQFDSVDSATKFLRYYEEEKPFSARGRRVYFQYSDRDKIVENKSGGSSAVSAASSPGDTRPGPIILVSILDCRVPVTLDHLYQVFSRVGVVLKIVLFYKFSVVKALVQFSNVQSAIMALSLDGKQMFQGCCVLRISFSHLTELAVKRNTPTARDYTVGSPTSSAYPAPAAPAAPADYVNRSLLQNVGYGGGGFEGAGMNADFMGGTLKGPVLLLTNLVEKKVNADVLFTLFGVYGDVMRVKIFFQKPHMALVEMSDAQQAYLAQLHLNHVQLFGKVINVLPSKHQAVSLPPQPQDTSLAKDYSNSAQHRFRHNRSKNLRHICPPSAVLHLSNLHDRASPQELRDLFGSKVQAVQFFKTDRRMAFVRMASTADAVMALIRHHATDLGGKTLRVSFSHKSPQKN